MINRTILVGRITKEVELKYTQSNLPVVKFTIAVNRTYGEKETDFICDKQVQLANDDCFTSMSFGYNEEK